MNLYLITRNNSNNDYDVAEGFVICTTSPQKARHIIVDKKYYGDEGEITWLDTTQSTCSKIGTASNHVIEGVVLRDYSQA